MCALAFFFLPKPLKFLLMKKEYIKKKWQLPKQKHVSPDFI
jgi:hypothetical protein